MLILLFASAVAGANNRLDVASNIEVAHNLNFPGVQQFYQIIEYDVHHVFVEDSAIPILVDVKLEALKFYTPFAGHVLDVKRGKVRKA